MLASPPGRPTMDDGADTTRNKTACDECHKPAAPHDLINVGTTEGGYRELGYRCYNESIAKACGLGEFEHPDLHPVVLKDRNGRKHEFHFRSLIVPTGQLSIEAFELKNGAPGGYMFQILGSLEEEPLALTGKLIERMQRQLRLRHLSKGEVGRYRIGDAGVVRARIDWDDDTEGAVPMLVIDGKEIGWIEFGRMLMSYEGWQLKLEVYDQSEER